MSNLLKFGTVSVSTDSSRVIDVSEQVARRLEEAQALLRAQMSPEEDEGGFIELNPEAAEALFGAPSGNVYRERPVYDGPSPEELVEQAQAEIARMREEAEAEIEALKQQAYEQALEEGRQEGYAAGMERAEKEARKAAAETEALRQELQQQYEQAVKELEPLLVDELTAIYDHVFRAGLKYNKEIIFHLLQTALSGVDSGKELTIRVSPDDYQFMLDRKGELQERVPGSVIELVPDATYQAGDCIIETGSGVFDCSLDVEMDALAVRLRMLSREADRGGEQYDDRY